MSVRKSMADIISAIAGRKLCTYTLATQGINESEYKSLKETTSFIIRLLSRHDYRICTRRNTATHDLFYTSEIKIEAEMLGDY